MTNMRVYTMAAIRNARGLTPDEKVLLYTIESRGEAFARADTLQDDCGMGRNRFYRTRKGCVDRGLVDAKDRRPRGTTVYRVNHEAVSALAPDVTPGREAGLEDTIVSPGSQINVTPARDVNMTAGSETKRTLEGTPQGDPQGEQVRRTPYGVVRGVGAPIYLRMVRRGELNAWDKVEFGVHSFTEAERAEWHARLDAEADLL